MKNKRLSLYAGLLILAFFLVMTLAPGIFTSYAPKDMFKEWLKPSNEHLLGTNSLGCDIFTELVYGARETIFVGILSSALTMAAAIIIGFLSAAKGFVGRVFSGLINIFLMLPKLVCIIVLSAFFSGDRLSVIILIAVFSWAPAARSIRAKVLQLSSAPFAESLKLLGFSPVHISVFHILPNTRDVLLPRFLLEVNSCILMESSLAFLGIGDIYNPTWGSIVNIAYKRGAFLRGAYWYLLTPGLCIAMLSLAFSLIASYLEHRKESI